MTATPFLTADWRYLLMLTYRMDSSLLAPLVPKSTELDSYNGATLASVVGFMFMNTKVKGCSLPGLRNFEEVNLRFYVRRASAEGWRRGVVFIRELVPHRVIAWVARTCYGEPYTSLPMRHRIEHSSAAISVEYEWRRDGAWESIKADGIGEPVPVESGSLEEFITEHYWGYTAKRANCSEYQVEHPRWRVWRAKTPTFSADISALYGAAFSPFLSAPPVSALIADGSAVTVRDSRALNDVTRK
jgi:uncharacterized protein